MCFYNPLLFQLSVGSRKQNDINVQGRVEDLMSGVFQPKKRVKFA